MRRFTLSIAASMTALLACILMMPDSFAATGLDTGNTTWVAISTALVLIMAPGIAIFYGGMLRKQSMTSIMAQTLLVVAVMTLTWIAFGYTLAFGEGGLAIGEVTLVGGLDNLFLMGIEYTDMYGDIPLLEFMIFQGAFALVTAVVVIGACAERIRFKAILAFLVLWSLLVYSPMAHWVWGLGLFEPLGFTVLDFAGGTVVHICAATSGLALALYAGRRSERIVKDRAHNLPLVFLGFALIWVGWFGFNGGSGLAANEVLVSVMVVTQISMAAGAGAWALVQYFTSGKTGVLGMISGAVAGLVSITPCAAYVSVSSSIIIGAVGAVLCYFGISFMRKKSGIDDALDVFGLHGIGGIWGSIATGIFALSAMTGGIPGVIEGGFDLMLGQIVAVIVTVVFCFAMSYGIIWLIGKFMDVRLSEDEQVVGPDIVEHEEPSYII